MNIYGYLRASTKEQDALRAMGALQQFAQDNNFEIKYTFKENVSGATLARPKLFEMLEILQPGDVIFIEQVDRITRLNTEDWNKLRNIINNKGLNIVSIDIPMSYQVLKNTGDEFTNRMAKAFNGLILEVLAASARKDYEDRRRRQAEGIQMARARGKWLGKRVNMDLRKKIQALIKDNYTQREIVKLLGCNAQTVVSARKALRLELENK